MTIRIRTPFQVFGLDFKNDEEFKKFHLQITEALIDESNTKGAFYQGENVSKMFPALLLKNSVIEIDVVENKPDVFFF